MANSNAVFNFVNFLNFVLSIEGVAIANSLSTGLFTIRF